MSEGTLQTKVLILIMVAVFIGVGVGAVFIARGGAAQHPVKLPDPFRATAPLQQ